MLFYKYPYNQKLQGLSSGVRGAQFRKTSTGQRTSLNVCNNNCCTWITIYGEAPSWIKIISCRHHRCCRIRISNSVTSQHIFAHLQQNTFKSLWESLVQKKIAGNKRSNKPAPYRHFRIIQGFNVHRVGVSSLRMWQLCVFTCPLRWKLASSAHKMFYGQESSTTMLAKNFTANISQVFESSLSGCWSSGILYAWKWRILRMICRTYHDYVKSFVRWQYNETIHCLRPPPHYHLPLRRYC